MTRDRISQSCVCCGSINLQTSPAILMPFIAHRVFHWKPVEIDESWGLRTIKNGVAYSICNSMLCTKCFHLFLDIRFTDDEMDRLYRGYRGEEYTSLREHYEPGYQAKNASLRAGHRYIAKVEEFLRPLIPPSPAILDWGGDSGKNTPFRNHSKQTHIYDISESDVIGETQKVSKETAKNTSYDLIVCSHVLEHLPFPGDSLADIRTLMKSNTVLYIELPHENLVRTAKRMDELHISKKHWHEHINFFNETSLRCLLERQQFKILKLNQLAVSGETSDFMFQVAVSLGI